MLDGGHAGLTKLSSIAREMTGKDGGRYEVTLGAPAKIRLVLLYGRLARGGLAFTGKPDEL